MLSLCKKNKKINLLHHSSLYQDKGHLVVAFCIVWCFLGAIRHCWRGSFRVIGILYGKKKCKVWKVAPLCIFWTTWKENGIEGRLITKSNWIKI